MNPTLQKISIAAAVLAVTVFGLLTFPDTVAENALEANTGRALTAFGIAKAINAVISMIQGTELSFTPIGIGLTLSVGELLDPLNDMVERFSWIMLFSSVSLVIQSFLIKLSASTVLKGLLAATGFAVITALLRDGRGLGITVRLFVILAFLRFFVIGTVALETLSFDALLAPVYTEATGHLERTRSELKRIEEETVMAPQEEDEGFLGFIGRRSEAVMQMKRELKRLEHKLDAAQNEMLNLIAVFVFQTLLVPLFFLWVLTGLLKWALRSVTDVGARFKAKPLTG